MIEFGGTIYYIDMNELEKNITMSGTKANDKVTLTVVDAKGNRTIKTYLDADGKVLSTEKHETSSERGREIDATKYDLIRLMIEVLIDSGDDIDDSLGSDRALEATSLSYKLAFNTLYQYGILKEVEEK